MDEFLIVELSDLLFRIELDTFICIPLLVKHLSE
jgi:hypothetical protein